MLPCDVDDLTLPHYFFEVKVVFRMVEIVKFDKFTTIFKCAECTGIVGKEKKRRAEGVHLASLLVFAGRGLTLTYLKIYIYIISDSI